MVLPWKRRWPIFYKTKTVHGPCNSNPEVQHPLRNKPSYPSPYRKATLIAAGITAALGILLGLSVAHGLFRFTFFLDQPGALFVAGLRRPGLCNPRLFFNRHPDPSGSPVPPRIEFFSLSCTIFPFLTLAFGSYVFRNFDHYGALSDLLNRMGKNLFEFLVILLTVAEIFGIAGLKVILFPEFRAKSRGKAPMTDASFRNRPRELLSRPQTREPAPKIPFPSPTGSPCLCFKGAD